MWMVETQLCKLRGTSDIYTNYRLPILMIFGRMDYAYIRTCLQEGSRKIIRMHTRVREFWNTHPPSAIHSIPLWPNQPINRTFTSHSIQTGHPIAFGFRIRLGIVPGGRRQASHGQNPPNIHIPGTPEYHISMYLVPGIKYGTWYQIIWYTHCCSINSTFHGIVFYTSY